VLDFGFETFTTSWTTRMSDELDSIFPSAVVLGGAGVIALFLTITRAWADENKTHIRAAVQVALVAILFQAAHFTEELVTDFHERFPALLGLAPMPLRFFVSFNLVWLVIWSICAWGLAARRRAALFPLWFLGVACIVNGIGHPLLSVLAGGYVPGLVTSPGVGVLGILLVHRLLSVTKTANAAIRSS
jgi:uncharacterized membrane protein YhdT